MGVASETKAKRGPGRPRMNFGPLLKTEILALMARGIGRRAACERLGIGYARFLRNLRDDPDFADRVEGLEEKRAEDCAGFLYDLAVNGFALDYRMKAAIAFLARKDRVDAARLAREDKLRSAEAKAAETAR